MDPAARAYERRLAEQEQVPARRLEGYAVWFDAALPARRGLALDYGAGRGGGVDYLRARGFPLVEAYEPNPALAAGLEARGVPVHAQPAGGAFLDARSGRYDLILCKDVLEHLERERTVETTRLLLQAVAPGGRLVVSVPHAVSFVGQSIRYADFTHRRSFTHTSLRYVLEAAGAREVVLCDPRFAFRPDPRTIAYRLAKRCWHAALRALYLLEDPSAALQPPHFHPRLVAYATPQAE